MKNPESKHASIMGNTLVYNAFLLLLIVVMLFFSWHAVRWFQADLLIRQVRVELTNWQQANEDLETVGEWEITRDKVDKAIEFRPLEPEYHRLRGYIYEWRFRAPVVKENTVPTSAAIQNFSRDTVDEILNAYRQSLAIRPTWPNTWAQFALVKGDMNQHDEEFINAVQQIIKYGKHVPRMQLDVNQLLVRNFTFIIQNPELFRLMRANTQRSFTNNANLVRQNINYFETNNMLTFACAWVDTSTISPVAQRACEQNQPSQ